ncbi:MAG: Rpn family recombination-promoting nuclease/putative transposase [Chloroflexota bacterium]
MSTKDLPNGGFFVCIYPISIIPIIFYHGQKDWNIDQQFANFFKYVHPELHRFVPKFDYIMVDTSKYTEKKIEQLISLGSLQTGLLLLKYIHDKGLEDKLIKILTPLIDAKLPQDELWPMVEAAARYLAGKHKNRVSEEKIHQAFRTVFAGGEGEMGEVLFFDRWREIGRQEGIELGREQGRQEERVVIENERQGNLKKHRKSIIGILNHLLLLSEADEAQITTRLEEVDDENAMHRLVNAALETSREGLVHFMVQLIMETDTQPS